MSEFQNVRFSKCEIFMKISHFGENLTKNVRFSQKCEIFLIIPQYVSYLKSARDQITKISFQRMFAGYFLSVMLTKLLSI